MQEGGGGWRFKDTYELLKFHCFIKSISFNVWETPPQTHCWPCLGLVCVCDWHLKGDRNLWENAGGGWRVAFQRHVWALKISLFYKKHIFQCMGNAPPDTLLTMFGSCMCMRLALERSEWVIKFNGLSGDSRQRGPYSPYKLTISLYIGIIIFPHVENTQSTGHN